jgi:hypothetical protein
LLCEHHAGQNGSYYLFISNNRLSSEKGWLETINNLENNLIRGELSDCCSFDVCQYAAYSQN